MHQWIKKAWKCIFFQKLILSYFHGSRASSVLIVVSTLMTPATLLFITLLRCLMRCRLKFMPVDACSGFRSFILRLVKGLGEMSIEVILHGEDLYSILIYKWGVLGAHGCWLIRFDKDCLLLWPGIWLLWVAIFLFEINAGLVNGLEWGMCRVSCLIGFGQEVGMANAVTYWVP